MWDGPNDLRAHRARTLLIALGQNLGLSVAYCAFERAAELEDRLEIARAAAWHLVGRAIIVAWCLSQRSEKCQLPAAALCEVDEIAASDLQLLSESFYSFEPAARAHVRRLGNSLGLLLESGRKNGSISAGSVLKLAQSVQLELIALLRALHTELSQCKASSSMPWPTVRDT